MIEPAKRIPTWLTIDIAVIVVSLGDHRGRDRDWDRSLAKTLLP